MLRNRWFTTWTRPQWALIRSFSHLQRRLNKNPVDPKHIFTEPKTNKILDSKHFFTPPHHDQSPDQVLDSELITQTVQQSLRHARRRKYKNIFGALVVILLGTVFGYGVGYKVLYLHEEIFIPVYPASKVRNLSKRDLQQLNVSDIKELAEYRVLEKLSMHPMIKEQYGIPLRTAHGDAPKTSEFSLWCEDQDPCIGGICIRPADNQNGNRHWHTLPKLLKWRFTYRSVSLLDSAEKILNFLGLETSDVFQVINPDKVLGEFKYEFPLRHHEENHAMHVWFIGEMKLSKNDLIIFKGKYHVDTKLSQIDLLRREDGKLIRYVLYQQNETSGRKNT
ncbi:LAMI_0G00518g1_1 [Lachancea mirantina]|uniref:LAMI_0G00518g1_1 n=1 Tax=Lachancea mirantina TaxID=1230905 RepID=A0A1G4K741_9SACH|nr:LAMI_0G00518g1_1 [Lachancea mirantina]